MLKRLLICSLIGKIHLILNLLYDIMFHQVVHKNFNYLREDMQVLQSLLRAGTNVTASGLSLRQLLSVS